MVAQTEHQPHYDTDTGDHDGQLPYADLVHQLPPPTYPAPELNNTLLNPTDWVYALRLPLKAQSGLLAIVRRVDWETGRNCWASVETLAADARLNCRDMLRQLRFLKSEGLIGRRRRRDGTAETWLILDREGYQSELPVGDTSRTSGCDTSRTSGCADGVRENRSFLLPIHYNQTKVIGSATSLVETGVTTGDLKSKIFEEEGATEPGATLATAVKEPASTNEQSAAPPPSTADEVRDWIDAHVSETPMDFEIDALGKHCWPAWEKHWELDFGGALTVWTADATSRRKFRKDLAMHLRKVGLPVIGENGELPQPEAYCNKCRAATTSPIAPFDYGGRRECDQCAKCKPQPVECCMDGCTTITDTKDQVCPRCWSDFMDRHKQALSYPATKYYELRERGLTINEINLELLKAETVAA